MQMQQWLNILPTLLEEQERLCADEHLLILIAHKLAF
jgi:hypothetical protein